MILLEAEPKNLDKHNKDFQDLNFPKATFSNSLLDLFLPKYGPVMKTIKFPIPYFVLLEGV